MNLIHRYIEWALLIIAYYLIIVYTEKGFWNKLLKIIVVTILLDWTYNHIWGVEGFLNQDAYPVPIQDRCRGGEYMHQGDSKESRECRDLIKQGVIKECQKGFNNLPLAPFEYTPQSDDNFENKQCSK